VDSPRAIYMLTPHMEPIRLMIMRSRLVNPTLEELMDNCGELAA